jgi:hypothetical protein
MGIKVTYSIYVTSVSGQETELVKDLGDRTKALETTKELDGILANQGCKVRVNKVVNHDGTLS